MALVLALLYARRQSGRGDDILVLLALLLLLRCVLDPQNNPYYQLPFVLSLLAWEGLRIAGLPALTLLSTAALWATFERFLLVQPALNNAFYRGWTLTLLSLRGRVALPVARSSLPARHA